MHLTNSISRLTLAFLFLIGLSWSTASAQVSKTDSKPGKKSLADDVNKQYPKKDSEHFMRIRKDAKGRPVALETSVTRYELTNDKGERITVDLIGARPHWRKRIFRTTQPTLLNNTSQCCTNWWPLKAP